MTSGWVIKRRACGVVAAVAITAALAGCGKQSEASADRDGEPPSEAEFVARVHRICLESFRAHNELPESVGGAKPVGTGAFMRTWKAKLRVPPPPQSVADHWKAGVDLLDRVAHKLDDAEAGDPEAQGEALWSLEPLAHKHFDAMHVAFRVCFVE